MQILEAFLFSFSANLDNLTIGIAYGIRGVHIGPGMNGLIALISGAGTFLSMTAGGLLAQFISPAYAGLLGSAILILMGLYFLGGFLLAQWRTRKNPAPRSGEPDAAPAADPVEISLRQAVTVAFALTVNNLAMGVGVSIAGLDPYTASAFTVVISLLTLALGQKLGQTFLAKLLGRFAVPISGLILLLLGLYELLA